ncbi:hypothetical protein MFIFM68171_09459 [Madurella fahalii]|uniref:RRM domain-containing protein n=1 Tax=Madurella fahalii TaxID=1157608 RepID=A0ABQ0GNB0_9PEZI
MSNQPEGSSQLSDPQDNGWQEIMEAQEADRLAWVRYMTRLGLGEAGDEGMKEEMEEDGAKKPATFLITGLPPNITVSSLLARIRNVGRVHTTRIIRHEDDRTATAMVAFFEALASKRFHNMYENAPLKIRGYNARVVRHCDAQISQIHLARNLSRAILVWGPPSQVERDKLLTFFCRNFSFRLDSITTIMDHPTRRCLEICFGSWRGEAQAAFKFLSHPVTRLPGVSVAYTMDPCDVGWTPPKGTN